MTYIVFDVESTGLEPARTPLAHPSGLVFRGSEVCQIGGLVLDSKMKPIKLFCHYCDIVAAESHPKAKEVHRIDMRKVREHLPGRFLPEILTKYVPEFFLENVLFIGYNVEYDMTMVKQTLSNSPISFEASPLRSPLLPKGGRHSVDIMPFLQADGKRRKLSSYEGELYEAREQFLAQHNGKLGVDTNCIELLQGTWDRAHNSFFDSLNTFLLWRDKVWRKKLI